MTDEGLEKKCSSKQITEPKSLLCSLKGRKWKRKNWRWQWSFDPERVKVYVLFGVENEGCGERVGKKGMLSTRKNQFVVMVWQEWERKLTFGLEPAWRQCAKLLLCVWTDMRRWQLSHWKACSYKELEGAKSNIAVNQYIGALGIFLTAVLRLAMKCITQVALWVLWNNDIF